VTSSAARARFGFSLVATLLVSAGRAEARPSVCWPAEQGAAALVEALRRAAPNVELRTGCRRACRRGQAWCLGWTDGHLVLTSGRTRLVRAVDAPAESLPQLVEAVGITPFSVYLESLAVEASFTTPDVEPPPAPPSSEGELPPGAEPKAPASEPAAAAAPEPDPALAAPDSEPAPPVWPKAASASTSIRTPASTPGARGQVAVESGVRVRSPSGVGPSFAVRVAVRPGAARRQGDRWSLFARLRGAPAAQTVGGATTLDTALLGADLGADWVWLRRPGARFALEAGVAGEWLHVVQRGVGGDFSRDGGAGGAFLGPTFAWELGAFHVGALITGYVFPTGLTVRRGDDTDVIGRWGLRAGVSGGWRF